LCYEETYNFANYVFSWQSYRDKYAIKQREIQDVKRRVNLTEKKSKEIFEDNFLSSVEKNISRFDLQKLEEDIPVIEDEELLPEIPEDGIVIFCNENFSIFNSNLNVEIGRTSTVSRTGK
jgi:hypothetical protein